MDLNSKTGLSTPMDLIPRGFMCWAMVTFRGMKNASTGSRYADVELTIADKQPYARKKIFTKVADPDHHDNSDKYKQMGVGSLTRMVEAAGLVNPEDDASYQKVAGRSIETIMQMLDGKYVAIKVKVEPGKDGYDDKNDVGDYLSPNPHGQSLKNFTKLTNGDHGVVTAPANVVRAVSGFAPTQAVVPQTQPAATAFAPQGNAQAAKPPEARGFNPNAAPAFLKAGQP